MDLRDKGPGSERLTANLELEFHSSVEGKRERGRTKTRADITNEAGF